MSDNLARCLHCSVLFTGTGTFPYGYCDDCRKQGHAPTVLADLLDQVRSHLQRFVVFPNEHGPVAATLWIASTHIVDELNVAPYLLITAPEIESGKTRLMEVAAPLVPRPKFSSSMTPAVLFGVMDKEHPTLFLDEADSIWTKHGDEKKAELVALLNAGHRPGAKASRMGGPGKTTLQEFDVFGCKCIGYALAATLRIANGGRGHNAPIRSHT